MTRSQIIGSLYISKEITTALSKMQPAEIRDDLKQEMFINLCSISDDKFWAIYNNNGTPGLKYWLVRCMLNMIYTTRMNQPFYRHYRAKHLSLDDIIEPCQIEDDHKEIKEEIFNQVEKARKNLTWYEDMLLDTYTDLKFNQKEISRRTGIPYISVVKTIALIKKKIRDET